MKTRKEILETHKESNDLNKLNNTFTRCSAASMLRCSDAPML